MVAPSLAVETEFSFCQLDEDAMRWQPANYPSAGIRFQTRV